MDTPAPRCIKLLAALLMGMVPIVGSAHEIAANRLTLVLREPTHIALTFVVDYVDLLNRTLAPGAARTEFAVICAAMDDEQLRRRLAQAQASFEKGLVITGSHGTALQLKALRWPDFQTSQRLLRDAAMGSVVTTGEHVHQDPVEIPGDVLASNPIEEIGLRLPPELQDVIVVSYRPTQTRIKAAAREEAMVKFR
jgi:hypothetical protein